jgi:FAD binding domain
MAQPLVLIAGGGIGGLATALTLHQIGVPCQVFESVREMKPLGVGINLQPNAVRELYDLGITEVELDEVGVTAKELGAGRSERQRHLLRDARAARRLSLAAVRRAPRPAAVAAVPQGPRGRHGARGAWTTARTAGGGRVGDRTAGAQYAGARRRSSLPGCPVHCNRPLQASSD